jgi:hypothetical protein
MNSFFERLEAQLQTAAQAQAAGSGSRLRTRWGWLRTGTRLVPILAGLVVTVGVLVVALGIGSHAHRVGGHSRGRVAGIGPGSTTTGAISTTTGHTAAAPPGLPDCNAAGIDVQHLREGTCVVGGASIVVVVNKTSTLRLKSLNANYAGLRRQGNLATFTITVKNKLPTPQLWRNNQAALFIPGTASGPNYLEDFAAENRDPNSCLWRVGTAGNGGLPTGASVTCDVIFEIPASADPMAPGSTLGIANFGDDVSNASQPVGTIRTYH